MIVFSCESGAKGERTPRPVFRLAAVATVRSLKVVLQHEDPGSASLMEVLWYRPVEKLYLKLCIAMLKFLRVVVKYPAVMLWDNHILC